MIPGFARVPSNTQGLNTAPPWSSDGVEHRVQPPSAKGIHGFGATADSLAPADIFVLETIPLQLSTGAEQIVFLFLVFLTLLLFPS